MKVNQVFVSKLIIVLVTYSIHLSVGERVIIFDPPLIYRGPTKVNS